MKQKNIAVLMTALDSDAQAVILKGIEIYGKRHVVILQYFFGLRGVTKRRSIILVK